MVSNSPLIKLVVVSVLFVFGRLVLVIVQGELKLVRRMGVGDLVGVGLVEDVLDGLLDYMGC